MFLNTLRDFKGSGIPFIYVYIELFSYNGIAIEFTAHAIKCIALLNTDEVDYVISDLIILFPVIDLFFNKSICIRHCSIIFILCHQQRCNDALQ